MGRLQVTDKVFPKLNSKFSEGQEYQKLKDALRVQIEYGIAKGGLIVKPYPVVRKTSVVSQQNNLMEGNQEPNKFDTNYEIEFDFIQANEFYPLAFSSSGKMTEAAFVQRKFDKNVVYSRLEYHKLEGNTVTVINKAFRANSTASGKLDYLGEDTACAELELAMGKLGELDGRQVTIDIVDSIFHRFCVGK